MMIRADTLSEIADHVTTIEQVEDKLCKECLKRAQDGNYDAYFSLQTRYVDEIVNTLTEAGYTVSMITSDTNIQTLHIQW